MTINSSQLGKANYVPLMAKEGCAGAVAKIVTPIDPGRAELIESASFWYGLRSESVPNRFAIFDLFADGAARSAYVERGGPARLQEQASTLVEHEVLANVCLYEVVGSLVPNETAIVTHVTHASFEVEPNETETVERWLRDAPSQIASSVPSAAHWYGLRDEQRPGHYAIVTLRGTEGARPLRERGDLSSTLAASGLLAPTPTALRHVPTVVIDYEVLYSKEPSMPKVPE
ncbi:MAG: hypothetical protein AAF500_10380 [Myxococcota bacterium]